MNWEQKFAAILAISYSASLRMRQPGNWYVSVPGCEIGGGATLRSVGSTGADPSKAIECTWEEITKLPPDKHLVIDAMRDTRRHVRWNGYMWEDLPIEGRGKPQ